MTEEFPYPLADDPALLSSLGGWDQPVYADFLAVQRGELSEQLFTERYAREQSVLALDLTGFTASCIEYGEMDSLLRILNAQRVCVPVLQLFEASFIRCFADNMVALFPQVDRALDAALEIQHRIALFNESVSESGHPAECCIGIGHGHMLAIGPNLAQGEEMNKASKLGEDIARAREILLTENAFKALKTRADLGFDRQRVDDQLFPFYQLRTAPPRG